MLSAFAAPSSLPGTFIGNRTHYSWGDIRNGSNSADPLFSSTASGNVSIGFGAGRNAESEGLDITGGRGEYIQSWAKKNNLNISFSNVKLDGMFFTPK